MTKPLAPWLLFGIAALAAGPTSAQGRCRADEMRTLARTLPDRITCQIAAPTDACPQPVPACAEGVVADVAELLFPSDPGAVHEATGRQVRCQVGAARAAARFLGLRLADRGAGRRAARRAVRMVRDVVEACHDTRVGSRLPRFGGACASLLEPGLDLPARALGRCLRASLEGLVDRAAPVALRPNVVLVLTDDQRPETLDTMPTIDRLASQGVRFENAFATTAVCTPSRASIYSGLYAHHHGSFGNAQAFDDSDTLAPWLSEQGYATGFFGKYRNDTVPGSYVPPGWSEWQAFGEAPDGPLACPAEGRCYFDYMLNENGVLESYGSREDEYSTDLLADRVLAFIDENAGAPFLAVYAPIAAHVPVEPAPRHVGTFADLAPWRPASWGIADPLQPVWVAFAAHAFGPAQMQDLDLRRQREIESLQAVDEAVDHILADLERRGLRDNTLVIFTSDHGIHWGEHGWTSKLAAYEESIRVPFVVSHPARTPVGSVRPELVLNIDIAPSIADAAGATPGPVDGASFLPLLAGPAPWRQDLLVENFIDFVVRPNVAVRTTRWKYIETTAPNGVVEELYDLEADPDELHNLAFDADHRVVRALLRQRLTVLLAQ